MSKYGFLLLVFLFLGLRQGVELGFADSPATQPSIAGPKEAFRTFLVDLRKGDAQDLPGDCIARQEDSRALLRDFQSLAGAIGELREAAAKKYGADAVESVMPDMYSPDDVDEMTENDKADHVELHGQVGDVQMVQSGGGWKLDLDNLRHGPDIPANPHYFAEFARAILRTADDIASGKLDTATAAAEAIRAREQAIDEDAPTTQPTTQAPTQP